MGDGVVNDIQTVFYVSFGAPILFQMYFVVMAILFAILTKAGLLPVNEAYVVPPPENEKDFPVHLFSGPITATMSRLVVQLVLASVVYDLISDNFVPRMFPQYVTVGIFIHVILDDCSRTFASFIFRCSAISPPYPIYNLDVDASRSG